VRALYRQSQFGHCTTNRTIGADVAHTGNQRVLSFTTSR